MRQQWKGYNMGNYEVGITVIMPVYKVEKYVAKAIECVLNQTFKDFEFIIVDDGTPDNSGKICDEYAKKDGAFLMLTAEESDVYVDVDSERLAKANLVSRTSRPIYKEKQGNVKKSIYKFFIF